MIIGIGVDTVSIARIEAAWQRGGERFLHRLFTAAELAYCTGLARPTPSLAARFCAKEATMKCLGTGWTDGITFASIEVVRATTGAGQLLLHAAANHRARALGITHWHLSLTHTDTDATAFVVGEG